MWRLTILLSVLFLSSNAHRRYMKDIPNGSKVPNPCPGERYWTGVGHNQVKGKGPLNQFGMDFMKENKEWTKTLCVMDSDGDGQSNGVELGDPECKWTKGSELNLPKATGHPGICEPLTSALCKKKGNPCNNHIE